MPSPDMRDRSAAQKALLAVCLVLAIAAVVLELMVLMDRLPSTWGSIGGGLIVLSLALSVIGRRLARGSAPDRPPP